LDLFDCYFEPSCFVAASHVGVEVLHGVFLPDCLDILGEWKVVSSFAQLARYLE